MRADASRRLTRWSPLVLLAALFIAGSTGCSFDATVGQRGDTSVGAPDVERADSRGDGESDAGLDTGSSSEDTATGCRGAGCVETGVVDTGRETGTDTGRPDDTGTITDTGTATDTGKSTDTGTTNDTGTTTDSGTVTDSGSDTATGDTSLTGDTCSGTNCGVDTGTPPVDLTGRWVARGYNCRGNEVVEVVDIKTSNNTIVAEKIAGDNCVGDGENSFRIPNPPTIKPGDSVSIELNTSGGYIQARMSVPTRDTLELPNYGVEFARADTSNLTSVGLTGTWETLDYECNRRYPSGQADVSLNANKLAASPTSGRHCFDDWEGTRNGKSFSVTVGYTDGWGRQKQTSGTAKVLAREFLLIEVKGFDWEIRMWSPSLF